MGSTIRTLLALALVTLAIGACASPRDHESPTNGHAYYGAGGGAD